jgi:hypothetical protein
LKKDFAQEIEAGIYPILESHPYMVFKYVAVCEKFSELSLQQGLLLLRDMDQRVKTTGGLPNHLLREMIFSWKRVQVAP